MSVQETLRKAAEIMSERGMTKGEYINQQGEVCMSGAVHMACGSKVTVRTGTFEDELYLSSVVDEDEWFEANQALGKFVKEEYGYAYYPAFNDESSTTLEDAVLALKRASEEV